MAIDLINSREFLLTYLIYLIYIDSMFKLILIIIYINNIQ